MKIKKCIFYLITIFISLFMMVNCTTLSKKNDRSVLADPYGTWHNSEYNIIENKAARIVYNDDGVWAAFDSEMSISPMCIGTITITAKWNDKQGNSWFNVTTNQCGFYFIVYELWRLNHDGTIMEGVWNIGSAPDILDMNDPSYTIYFRDTQEAHTKPVNNANKVKKNA